MSGGAAGSAGRPTATPILHPPVPDLDLMGPCALDGSPTPRAAPLPGPGREAVNGGGSRPARHPAARGHSPTRHGRGPPAAWRGGAAPPPHPDAGRYALPYGAGPRTPAPRPRTAGRVVGRGSTPAPLWCRARRTALRRGATHPRATVADRDPLGARWQQPRPTLGAPSAGTLTVRCGATHPCATVADRRPRGEAGKLPRLTLMQGEAPPCLIWHHPGPGVVPLAVPPAALGAGRPRFVVTRGCHPAPL